MRFASIILLMAIFAYPSMAQSNDYYTSAMGKTGDELRVVLHELAEANHTGDFSKGDIKRQLQYTDEDPHNPDNIIMFYTQQSVDKAKRDPGSGDRAGHWNNEHVWPRSHGVKNIEDADVDLHNLRAADHSMNDAKRDDDIGIRANGVFEPPDDVKGDVARILFYMDVRYEVLELVDRTTNGGETKFGKLCTLLKWNLIDLPDENEYRRHERIVERQGNINPFIDHPNWANDIWGNQCN